MLRRLEEPDLAVIRMQEVLQQLEAQAQLRAKTGRVNTSNAERMSRIGSVSSAAERQQNGSRTDAFLSKGSPHARALNTSRIDFPSPSEALSGPSLIFNSATSQDRCGCSICKHGRLLLCLTSPALSALSSSADSGLELYMGYAQSSLCRSMQPYPFTCVLPTSHLW